MVEAAVAAACWCLALEAVQQATAERLILGLALLPQERAVQFRLLSEAALAVQAEVCRFMVVVPRCIRVVY